MNRDVVLLSVAFILLISVHLSEEQSKLAKAFDDLQIEFVKIGLIINDILKELTGMDLTQWLQLLPGGGEQILKLQEQFFAILGQLGAALGGGGGH